MIETQIVSVLKANAGVAAIAGTRITAGFLVSENNFPAIVVRRSTGNASYTFGGDVSYETTLAVITWGPGWAVARSLAEAVRAALDMYAGGAIEVISVSDGEDIPVAETGEYGCTLLLTVQH